MNPVRYAALVKLLPSAVGITALTALSSCGSGGGGGLLGDLQTDLIITSSRSVPSEVRARNLTIAAGVTVTSPGDLKIQTAGTTTIEGELKPEGGLTIISPGAVEMSDTSDITVGDGEFILVSDPALVPTAAQIDAETSKDVVTNGSATRASKPASGRDETVYRLRPVKYKDSVRGRNLWVDVSGRLKVGKPNTTFVQTMPPGKDGADGASACTSTGSAGSRGGSAVIRAVFVELSGNITLNLGRGGKGGSASTPGTCCPATATGGRGGDTGTARIEGSTGIDNAGTLSVAFGGGGAGGSATATGRDGTDGCGPTNGCAATSTGGAGGVGARASSATGNVTGASGVSVSGGTGGAGGASTATSGKGGNDTCVPGTTGGTGGAAGATGGNGGSSQGPASGGIILGGGFIGGNGGNATATARIGGNGNTCCAPVARGGAGGRGGAASAAAGSGAAGTTGAGTDGTTAGAAGNGGSGGGGSPVGAAGVGGIGTGVPNGQPGSAGNPCTGGSNCKDEVEPNDSVGLATDMGTLDCAAGTLSTPNDLDHFKKTLPAGNYRITFPSVAAGLQLFLQVGSQAPITRGTGSSVDFTVPTGGALVVFGFFNGPGAYQMQVAPR
jgi:hypothetical protein